MAAVSASAAACQMPPGHQSVIATVMLLFLHTTRRSLIFAKTTSFASRFWCEFLRMSSRVSKLLSLFKTGLNLYRMHRGFLGMQNQERGYFQFPEAHCTLTTHKQATSNTRKDYYLRISSSFFGSSLLCIKKRHGQNLAAAASLTR
jgi:hypothetical protein